MGRDEQEEEEDEATPVQFFLKIDAAIDGGGDGWMHAHHCGSVGPVRLSVPRSIALFRSPETRDRPEW